MGGDFWETGKRIGWAGCVIMKTNLLVSVIVPVFDGERYLAEALESVRLQRYRPIEIVVVDDGSTDGSAAVAQGFPEVRYVYQAHAGLGAALNRGIQEARGELFSFLDADDLWAEEKLEKQMACLQDSRVEGVFAHVAHFKDDAPSELFNTTEGYFKGTLLIRREAFFRVGLFDPQWRVGDFIDWFIRAQEQGLKTVMLPDVLLKRRVHENNMTTRERGQRKAYVHILKAALDRRGKSNS